VKISQVTMTPALASKLLQGNVGNRTLVQQRIAAIAADIANGHWRPDGSPIRIGKSGKLLDGQHRLSAIVRADREVAGVVLIEDLDDDVQLIIDTNKSRTFNDYLVVRGYPDHLTAATVTSLLWRWEHGVIGWEGDWIARPMATLTDLWDLFTEHEIDIRDAVAVARKASRYVRLSRSVLAVGFMACSDLSVEDAEDFWAQLGGDRTPGNAAAVLIRVMNARAADRSVSTDQTFQLAFLFKAWNAYREGREISILRWMRGGKNREKFPMPV